MSDTADVVFTDEETRVNFPFPREIRDKIYEYLLQANHVRSYHHKSVDSNDSKCDYSPEQATTPVYKFHTNILAVNKTIHDEAEEILWRRNVFIMISHHFSAWNRMPLLTDVPIVSTKGLMRFRNASLQVKLGFNPPPMGRCQLQEYIDRQELENRSQGFLMVANADDINILCRMLQWQFCLLSGPCIHVKKEFDDEEASLEADVGVRTPQSMRTWMELKSTRWQPCTENVERLVLDPFMHAVGSCQNVRITGPVSYRRLTLMPERMSPKVISPDAVMWSLYEASQSFKAATDELALSGHYLRASERYMMMIELLRDSVCKQAPSQKFRRHSGCGSYIRTNVETMLADCAVTYAWLRMRCNLPVGGNEQESHALQMMCMSSPIYPASSFVHMAHISTLEKLVGKPDGPAPNALGWIMALSELESWQTRADSPDKYLSHDIELLRRHQQARTTPSPCELSFAALPVRTFSTPAMFGRTEKPSNFVGWQDKDLCARLSKNDRMLIHDMQSSYNLPHTDFDSEDFN